MRVKNVCKETKDFTMKVGFQQEMALSPYLFSLLMDELTKSVQDGTSWCMMFRIM